MKILLGNKYNVAEGSIRIWALCYRQNKTLRPDAPILENDILMDTLRAKHSRNHSDAIFYVENTKTVPESPSKTFLFQKDDPTLSITLFIKLYDPLTCKLQ